MDALYVGRFAFVVFSQAITHFSGEYFYRGESRHSTEHVQKWWSIYSKDIKPLLVGHFVSAFIYCEKSTIFALFSRRILPEKR